MEWQNYTAWGRLGQANPRDFNEPNWMVKSGRSSLMLVLTGERNLKQKTKCQSSA